MVRSGTGQYSTISTMVGRFHTWRPDIPPEGYHPHWRRDCYVLDEGLAPDWLTKLLADALVGRGAVSEPIWLGWYRTNEIGGEARGEEVERRQRSYWTEPTSGA
jgi:hypothetical protein